MPVKETEEWPKRKIKRAQSHRTQGVSRKVTLTVREFAKKLVRCRQVSAKLVNMGVFHRGMEKVVTRQGVKG